MSEVIFVMGMSGAGKSSFIKKHFKDYFVLDLLDFQKELWGDHVHSTKEMVLKSYENLMSEILNQLDKQEVIIVEHTLLKRIRREPYIEAIKSRRSTVKGYFLDITEERYKQRNPGIPIYNWSRAKEVQDIPVLEEGFDELYIIKQL